MTVGDFFGEIALLRNVPGTATVTATSTVSRVVIAREDFLAAIGSNPRSWTSVDNVASERLAPARGALAIGDTPQL